MQLNRQKISTLAIRSMCVAQTRITAIDHSVPNMTHGLQQGDTACSTQCSVTCRIFVIEVAEHWDTMLGAVQGAV
jgi:hypothetical protein